MGQFSANLVVSHYFYKIIYDYFYCLKPRIAYEQSNLDEN